MAFHELATNAAKYGALSNTTGKLLVKWEVLRSSNAKTLQLQWAESGGPPVNDSGHKGFGSILLERGLSLEVDGEVQIDLDPSGLICTMQIPLPALGTR
jgi:two-component sensor histidine kinase